MQTKSEQTYLELLNLRNRIVSLYFQNYYDFELKEPISIDEKEDITLDFVNCTICLAKEKISRGQIGNNYVMLQPCLRNNHINLLSNYNEQSNYLSYFTMLGGFCYINKNSNWKDTFNKIVERQFNFFTSIMDRSEIRLTIPIQYAKYLPLSDHVNELLLNNNGKTYYSNTDEKNLKWKYGIDGIIGYGTRWEIKNIDGIFINCGNDIVLFNRDNEAVGIDFGSGLETLVSLSNGCINLLYSNIVCSDYIKKISTGNALNEKLIDSILSLICCEYYKKEKNVRIKYLMSNYIRIISAIAIINNISDKVIMNIIKDICINMNIDDINNMSLIIVDINKQKNFLYEISSSDNVIKRVKYCENKNNNYEKKLFNIEIYALKKIIEEEKNSDKTQKIKKRR